MSVHGSNLKRGLEEALDEPEIDLDALVALGHGAADQAKEEEGTTETCVAALRAYIPARNKEEQEAWRLAYGLPSDVSILWGEPDDAGKAEVLVSLGSDKFAWLLLREIVTGQGGDPGKQYVNMAAKYERMAMGTKGRTEKSSSFRVVRIFTHNGGVRGCNRPLEHSSKRTRSENAKKGPSKVYAAGSENKQQHPRDWRWW